MLGDGRSGKLGDAVTLGEIIGSNVDVELGVNVTVKVGIRVVVGVKVLVCVIVEVDVKVGVAVDVAVSVCVGVGVGLGVAVALAVSEGRGVGLCRAGKYGSGTALPGVGGTKTEAIRVVVTEISGRKAPCCQAGRTGVRVLGNGSGFADCSPSSWPWTVASSSGKLLRWTLSSKVSGTPCWSMLVPGRRLGSLIACSHKSSRSSWGVTCSSDPWHDEARIDTPTADTSE